MYDDMYSDALYGLVDAAIKYDPDRGYKFCSFANRLMDYRITDGMRVSDYLPRHARARLREGKPIKHLSIDATYISSLPHIEPKQEEIDKEVYVSSMIRKCGRLTNREKYVIQSHYWDEITVESIGKSLGVNQSMVSHILASALKKLRAFATQ